MSRVIARDYGPPQTRALLERFEFVAGDINAIIQRLSTDDNARFNVVNLDYLGRLTAEKMRALRALIGRKLLADRAIIIVTLSESALERSRAKAEGITQDFYEALTDCIERAAPPDYRLVDRAEIRYGGGTNGGTGTPMRVCNFSVIRDPQNKA